MHGQANKRAKMKTIKINNYNVDLQVIKILHQYIDEIGLNPALYNGKSSRKVYSKTYLDYQVIIHQTKKHIIIEVQK